ncbi:MAG: hypothetical protein JSW68_12090, partial [Burkholderiales bacterium]
MVFSLFGLKLRGESRKRRDSRAGRAQDTTLRGPTTTPLNDRDAAKRAVVAKIDAIESEMALDVIPEPGAADATRRDGSGRSMQAPAVGSREPVHPPRPAARSAEAPAGRRVERGPARATGAAAARAAGRDRRTAHEAEAEAHSVGAETSQIIGDEADAFSLEISGSGVPAEIEEAAILYSNNQAETALMLLRHAVEGNQLGPNAEQAWLMLLDLYQLTGRRAEVEDLAINYAARFETSPPTWVSEQVAESGAEREREAGGSPPVVLPPIIDANAVRQFETVSRFLQRDGSATVDAAAVASVDPVGAEILLRALSAWAAT